MCWISFLYSEIDVYQYSLRCLQLFVCTCLCNCYCLLKKIFVDNVGAVWYIYSAIIFIMDVGKHLMFYRRGWRQSFLQSKMLGVHCSISLLFLDWLYCNSIFLVVKYVLPCSYIMYNPRKLKIRTHNIVVMCTVVNKKVIHINF